MRVLHTNIEDPRVVWWSTVPILPVCRDQRPDAEVEREDTVPAFDPASARRKQKRENDSVSCILDYSNVCNELRNPPLIDEDKGMSLA